MLSPSPTVDIELHDQSHLEFSLSYPLADSSEVAKKFRSDFYFFIPRSIAKSASVYSKEQFYSDITNRVRAHTPYLEQSDRKLVEQIAAHLSHLLSGKESDHSNDHTIRNAKLFGSTIKKRLALVSAGQFEHLPDILDSVKHYRYQCVQPVIEPSLRVPADIRQTLLIVDEYLSNRIETILLATKQESVEAILRSELRYRNERKDLFVLNKTTDSEREYYFYRQGLLRKVISSPLFLEIKLKKLDTTYRNWVASLGAALAALWAQFAEHHAYRSTHASDFGFQFIAVAGFAVAIYVFKDRIKDLSKEYVNEKLKGHVPDQKGILVDAEHRVSGATSEYVRYLEEKSVRAEIRYLRRLAGRWDLEHPYPDSVLHYSRTFDLRRDKSIENGGLQSVKDILRFDFSFFLKHLDDPIKHFSAYDEEDGVVTQQVPKVYHLNLVFRLESDEEAYHAYRLVLNRTGILRIETIFQESNS